MKFDFSIFFQNLEKIQVGIKKYEKKHGYFTEDLCTFAGVGIAQSV